MLIKNPLSNISELANSYHSTNLIWYKEPGVSHFAAFSERDTTNDYICLIRVTTNDDQYPMILKKKGLLRVTGSPDLIYKSASMILLVLIDLTTLPTTATQAMKPALAV